jgi:hypothetical protein
MTKIIKQNGCAFVITDFSAVNFVFSSGTITCGEK